jgi:hypothetical protein
MAAARRRKIDQRGLAARVAGGAGGAALRVLKAAGVPLMALLIYVAGVWCLWQYAARGGVRPSAPQTDAEACEWLGPRDLAEINSAVRFGNRASMYDRGICERVAACYEGKPWIDRVVAVRRHFPNRIVVDLAIRRPFAYVRSGRRLILVDRGGYRLPVKSVTQRVKPCPVIDGVRENPPSGSGHWRSRGLADSLKLASLLKGLFAERSVNMRLADVEVTEQRGTVDSLPQLVARTESGLLIDWGSFNESKSYLYPSVEEKRIELERALDEVTDPAGIESIMVRYRGCSVRPKPGWSAGIGYAPTPGDR